uniref:Uncharacterized protein n=1 Tax=Arundo donax TaxID=35708 RepID=A0A0A8ZWD0_ARUDO
MINSKEFSVLLDSEVIFVTFFGTKLN